ncbi:MAG: ExbD/TolR family protein [Pseudomonadota bacterium]
MAFGGFESGDEAPMAEMNVIPLVDIMLVLLVIFIITAPVITHAVKVELPQANSAPSETDETTLQLTIHADARLELDQQPVTLERLEARLSEALSDAPQRMLHLHAAGEANYELVARAMAAARRAGIQRIGFITQPEARHD